MSAAAALSSRPIRGVWATVLLRATDSGGVDLDSIDAQIEALAEAGVDGVYAHGTAGEVHSVDEEQWTVAARRTAAAAARRAMPFQIGAAHPLAPGSLARVRAAAALAPRAIQVTLPDWTAVDLATAERFLRGCADGASGVPLVLYNPPFARTVLSPAELMTLGDRVPELEGLKSGGGDDAWYAAMAPVFERLAVFIPGHHYASGRAKGAHGAYSNMACLSPKGAVAWARLAEEDPPAALAVETRIGAFFADAIHPLIRAGLPPFACDKALAAAGGWVDISPCLLWPYIGADREAVDRIRRAAERHIPDILAGEADGASPRAGAAQPSSTTRRQRSL